MAIDKWDEESINGLFRQYQQTRDGVSFEHYRPIMEAAREIVERVPAEVEDAETEYRMEQIRDSAREMLIAPDRSEIIDWASRDDRRRSRGAASEWFDEIKHGVNAFFDSLNPARWVPVAVTAVLIAVVVPFVIDTTDKGAANTFVVAQVEVLQQNAEIISGELDALNSFQLGFSSSGSDFAAAFGAGILFIDLVSLSSSADQARIEGIETALLSVTADRVDLVSGVEQLDRKTRTAVLGDRLQQFYSENPYSSVFVLGQWVESNYMLTKIVQQGGDAEVLLHALDDIDEIAALLSTGGHYSAMLKADFNTLKQLANVAPIDGPAAKKISLILLKMRSYLAGS